MNDSLAGKPHIETSFSHPLIKEFGDLCRKYRLQGAVLVSFSGDRVGINSSGESHWGPLMEWLADRILADINSGRHDPE